jgi:predicted  nucleic acid-binding Zn-ribbon protein
MNEFVGPEVDDSNNKEAQLARLTDELHGLKITRIKFERRYDWSKQAIQDAVAKIDADIATITEQIDQLKAD